MATDRLLSLDQISKAFPGVQALDAVDFELRAGEVHALVGENGAGKSTLIKVLSGVHQADSGTLWLDGHPVRPRRPRDMMDLGVSVIYQELNLVPGLSVAENLFLGREPIRKRTRGVIDWAKMYGRSARILERFQLPIDPRVKVGRLGIAYQQIVEIARAVSSDARVVIMDEPTAALTPRETDRLLEIIAELKKQSVSVIYISHRLGEIERIADRVTVLRDGKHIITADQKELSRDEVIRYMVGRSIDNYYPKVELPHGDVLLEVEGLTKAGVCEDVSFQLRRGEILGLAGLAGSGRTEIAELLFGRRKPDHGNVVLDGRPIRVRAPRDAVRNGIGLIPEERKSDGLVLQLSVFDNVTLASLRRYSLGGVIQRRRLAQLVDQVSDDVQLKAVSAGQLVKYLSGGNQQKVVLSKWLMRACQVYIFDEPTRGIDVGAKREIYRLMEGLAARGAGIIMISSEMSEVLNMSDRILVVCEGRISGELSRGEASQESILRLAVGEGGGR